MGKRDSFYYWTGEVPLPRIRIYSESHYGRLWNYLQAMHEMFLKSLISGGCCKPETTGIVKRFILPLTENFGGGFGSEVTLRSDNTVIVKGACMSQQGLQHVVIINPNYRFRKYRFAYGNSGFFVQGPYANKIVKLELTTGKETTWEFEENCLLGETIFIPNPDGINEDDGILLSGVYSQ
ncbi:unnamed protein product [Allacma fusca]|uniref:Uncharacterized protein n=1 Tax=Allacma fusca TaxID=39272 RepID=A0A8J2P2V3_9HEXA|nr:unnamed protein product [Allacma fusca]